ncbi:MAG: hypothetical protein ACI9HK_002172 [Pirellulaceae bacterium]|jgi:hypothetical protein
MNDSTRRTFNHSMLSSLLTYSVLETLFMGDVLADAIKPVAASWLSDVNEQSFDLKAKVLTATQWQKQVEKLMDKVNLPDLLKFIDFEKLKATVKLQDRGEKSFRGRFPEVEGLPSRLVFGHQIFGIKKGASVVPHGHNNMATAFLILQGNFHGRHYDRLEDTETHMVIKPTINDTFEPGGCSTISDEKDNVHWFKGNSDVGYIFNIHVMNVKSGPTGRVYIDPDGEKLSDGRINAKRISSQVAFNKFG